MTTVDTSRLTAVVIACEAGMGSSAMLAASLTDQLRSTGVAVEHTPIAQLSPDAGLVLVHAALADRVRAQVPGVPVLTFSQFIGDPAVTRLVAAVLKRAPIDV